PHVLGGPRVPRLDVQVGPADARAQHPHEDLAGTRARVGQLDELETGPWAGLGQCLHRAPLLSRPVTGRAPARPAAVPAAYRPPVAPPPGPPGPARRPANPAR